MVAKRALVTKGFGGSVMIDASLGGSDENPGFQVIQSMSTFVFVAGPLGSCFLLPNGSASCVHVQKDRVIRTWRRHRTRLADRAARFPGNQ